MAPTLILVILTICILFSLFSKGISRTIFTMPIVFMVFGYLISTPLHTSLDSELLDGSKRLLAEITLILVLFSDASHVRFKHLRQNWKIPARILVIGMPLTILFGVIVIFSLDPESGLAMALLTAAILTSTDAALGQSAVSSPEVPEHLSQSINIESGLNDGLVLPVVLLGAILTSMTFDSYGTDGLAMDAIIEIILGPLAGIVIGWSIARAMDWAQNHDFMDEAASGVVFLSAAFAAYAFAELIGGNGFIAAFLGGMVFGNVYRHDIHFIGEFMEGVGQLLTMSAFIMFGAFLLPVGLEHIIVVAVVVAVLSLTVVRMLPIFLSLTGLGLDTEQKLFLGWFGPRGLASILFTMIIVDEFELPNEEELLACVSMTVALSIILHGMTASPLVKRISKSRTLPG